MISLAREYKATTQLEAEAASLNWAGVQVRIDRRPLKRKQQAYGSGAVPAGS